MSMTIMVTGTLAKQPEQRTSKNGNPYCLASIRVQAVEGDLYAYVTAFGDLADTLIRLAKGDPITIIGNAKVSTYQGRDGDTKAGVSITASRIIAVVDHQAPPRQRQQRTDGSRQTPGSQYRRTEEFMAPAAQRESAPDPFQDSVPF